MTARSSSTNGAVGSVSLGTNYAGDLIVLTLVNFSSSVVPAIPTGYTDVTSGQDSANGFAMRVVRKLSTGNESLPSLTNTTHLTAVVYQGVDAVNQITNVLGQSGSGTSASYSGVVGYPSADDWTITIYVGKNASGVPTAPNNMGFTEMMSSGGRIAHFDSDGPLSSYSFNSKAISVSTPWITKTMVLRAGSSGGPSGPTEIWSIEDLDNIRNSLSGARIVGDFVLMRDLDFNDDGSYDNPANKSSFTTGDGWVPLGQTGNPWFGANIDGNGHVIKNLMVRSGTTGISNAGLIGVADDCTITDLGLINPQINANATNNVIQCGALIAGLDAEGTVNISRCFVEGGTVGGDDYVGGLIGIIHEYTTQAVLIQDCYSTAQVLEKGSNQDGFGLGSLIGTMNSVSSPGNLTVNRCYGAGLVDPGAVGVGAFQFGGLVGWDSTVAGVVTNSYYDTNVTTMTTSGGGTSKTTAQMKDIATFSNWTIEHLQSRRNRTWGIQQGRSYPMLTAQRSKIGTAF